MKRYAILIGLSLFSASVSSLAQTIHPEILLEKKGYADASQAEKSCAVAARSFSDAYKQLYCEPTVSVNKVRYSWTEIRNKHQLSGFAVNESSSRSSSSWNEGHAFSAFDSLSRYVLSSFSTGHSSTSGHSRTETPVFNEVPVSLKMHQDRDQVTYGYVLSGMKGVLNTDAPEVYDSAEGRMSFADLESAFSACNVNATSLQGFEHNTKCSAYQNTDGSYGYQITSKPKFK